MNGGRPGREHVPEYVNAACDRVTQGINLLNMLAIDDMIARFGKKGALLPAPVELGAMHEALVNATVLARKETLEAAYADLVIFWNTMCGYAGEPEIRQQTCHAPLQASSSLELKDPRALSLILFLRSVEHLRSLMVKKNFSGDEDAHVTSIIQAGNFSRASLVTPADRRAALLEIERAVTEFFSRPSSILKPGSEE